MPESIRWPAFVSEYRIEVSLDGQQWTPVADSHDRQRRRPAHRRKRLDRRRDHSRNIGSSRLN